MNTIAQYRNNFPGGNCTAYLTERDGALNIHTITRLGGGFIKSDPFMVEAAEALTRLRVTAENVPIL